MIKDIVAGAAGSSSAEDQPHDQGYRRRSSRIFVRRGSVVGLRTSSEEQQDLRLQRISRTIKDIGGGGVAGSSSAEDQQQDQGHRRRRSSRIFVRRGSTAGSRTSSSEEQQDQPHHFQRFQENFKILRRRKEGRPRRYKDLQNLKHHQIQAVKIKQPETVQ